MNKSQRIYLSSGDTGNDNQDKYIKVKLEQDVDTLEFMSISLGTTDVYQNFNSDYGVLVGRVVANGGVGIPNAKISIFIPLTDEDAQDSDIHSIYPYTTPRDKNNEGKRYNLLPRVSEIDPETGQVTPKQPFGSFPIKEEILGNESFLDVYKKYYKYTALTNYAGDYMIFGVPTGTQTVHLSADITDIGRYSMTPASMVTNLGYSPNLFTDNNTRIKPSADLNDLPNIETQEITVDIRPFWGDTENFEIGITRQDFRIRSVLNNTFVLFGSVFTDGDESMWGDEDDSAQRRIHELFRITPNEHFNSGMVSKRIGEITEKIYYYPSNITDAEIDDGIVDPTNDMLILDKSEYSTYKRNGDFAFIINCNRNKIITNQSGDETPIDDDSYDGVFTKFRGFVVLELTENDVNMNIRSEIGNDTEVKPFRFKLKFPQYATPNQSFQPTDDYRIENWRKQSYKFDANKYYSFSKFNALTYNNHGGYDADDEQFPLINGFFYHDDVNNANHPPLKNVGIILNEDIIIDDEVAYTNSDFEYPTNAYTNDNQKSFGANWMNLSVYFPQIGYLGAGYNYVKKVRSADIFAEQRKNDSTYNRFFLNDNSQAIAAGDSNTKWFARSDLNWTDIIEVPLSDIQNMNKYQGKGFKKSELSIGGLSLSGDTYRNGVNTPTNPTVNWSTPCPFDGGKIDGDRTNSPDPETYFYKGYDTSNCVNFLYELGIIS